MPRRSRRRRPYHRPPNRRNARNPSPDSSSSGSQTSDTRPGITPDNASSSASATSDSSTKIASNNASSSVSATPNTTDAGPTHGTIPHDGDSDQATDAPGESVPGLNDDVFEDGPRSPRDDAEMEWYLPLFTMGLHGEDGMYDEDEIEMRTLICQLERSLMRA